MIISQTPYRISFFGGGTDYPAWYREHGGAVLGTTIDKYCYIMCRYLPPFFDHNYRIVYSNTELVSALDEVQHPAVRECLRYLGISQGIELHHHGDLPARSGMGSSSAFTVGVLNSLYSLLGRMPSKRDLTRDAIRVEQDLIHENVGSQDQALTAIGGFNRIDFFTDDRIVATPMILPRDRLQELQQHLMLVFTGISRNASEIASAQIQATHRNEQQLCTMYQMVDEAINILASNRPIVEFGKLLDESWKLKRSLSPLITTDHIDSLYETASHWGACGGKLLGAGGGGFFLLFVPPERQLRVKEELGRIVHVPFAFSTAGSQIIYHNNGDKVDSE